MKKKNYMAPAFMLIIAFAAPLSVHAREYTTEVTNHVAIGDISIALSEYELDENGKEVPYMDNKLVSPGQTVDKIVRITNQANPCWLRMKAEYTAEGGLNGITDQDLSLASEKWMKIGEYYYYPDPIGTKETIDFIKNVKIPKEWDNDYAKKEFSIIMTADAVQKANFKPDWNSEDPWFGTVIETCVHTAYTTKTTEEAAFLVAFENGADGLVRTGDDFFSNWKDLMPGDQASGTVLLKNNYARTVTLWFRTETIAEDALLRALSLEIKSGEERIYFGTMDDFLKDPVKLAVLKKNEEKLLNYTVMVPKTLNNPYALSKTKTKWIFSADLPSSSTGGSRGSSGSSSTVFHAVPVLTPTATPSEAEPVPKPSEPEDGKTTTWTIPKTGDDSRIWIHLTLTGLFGCAAIKMTAAGKKQKKKEEHEHEN